MASPVGLRWRLALVSLGIGLGGCNAEVLSADDAGGADYDGDGGARPDEVDDPGLGPLLPLAVGNEWYFRRARFEEPPVDCESERLDDPIGSRFVWNVTTESILEVEGVEYPRLQLRMECYPQSIQAAFSVHTEQFYVAGFDARWEFVWTGPPVKDGMPAWYKELDEPVRDGFQWDPCPEGSEYSACGPPAHDWMFLGRTETLAGTFDSCWRQREFSFSTTGKNFFGAMDYCRGVGMVRIWAMDWDSEDLSWRGMKVFAELEHANIVGGLDP